MAYKINRDYILSNMNDDSDLLNNVIDRTITFIVYSSKKIKDSICCGDCKGTYSLFHELKGVLSNFCCDEIINEIVFFERLALEERSEELNSSISSFEVSMKDFISELKKL